MPVEKSKPVQRHGLLVLDKPKGPTSTRCLDIIKRQLGQKKIGHAGTLDPMAQGVLVALLGKGTKLANYVLEGRKTYRGRLRLGQTTDTYDAEGEITSEAPWEHLDAETVAAEVRAWEDLRTQTVPPYSAAKHKGVPLYKLSRQGKETPVKVKPMRVYTAEVLEMDLPEMEFRIVCGAGAYVRSLVHSLGMRLGCGAVLTALIREASEPFSLNQAVSLDQLLDAPERLDEWVLPLDAALPEWPRLRLDAEALRGVLNGQAVPALPGQRDLPRHEAGARALMLGPDGEPAALAEAKLLEDGRPVWAVLRGLAS